MKSQIQLNRFYKKYGALFERRAVILMYHRISDVFTEPNWLTVSPKNFSCHLELIRKEYHPIRLDDLIEKLKSGRVAPKSVAITFDDGYQDNYRIALPILEKYQIPATIFVTAGFVGRKEEFWWDELSKFLLTPKNAPSSLKIPVDGKAYAWSTVTQEQRQGAYSELKEIIKPFPPAEKGKILNFLAEWSGIKREPRNDFNTIQLDELIDLNKHSLIDIGAHTMTHPILPTLSNQDQLQEISESKTLLENYCGKPIMTFTYPNGDYSITTLALVKQAGFQAACITQPGYIISGDDIYKLRRNGVNNWGKELFSNKIEEFFLSRI